MNRLPDNEFSNDLEAMPSSDVMYSNSLKFYRKGKMNTIPSAVKIASDKWIPVKQNNLDGKLGYWDSDAEEIVIESKQDEVGKWVILIHEMLHAIDEQNVANGLYPEKLSEEQVTYLSAGLFASLGVSKIIGGIPEDAIMKFFSGEETYG